MSLTLLFDARALSSALTDNFDDNSRDVAKWNEDQFLGGTTTGVTVAEAGKHLEVTGPAATSAARYSGYVSVNTYFIDTAFVRLDHIVVQASEAMYLGVGTNSSNAYYALIDSGTLYLFRRAGGVDLVLTTVGAWSPTTHQWLRLRWGGLSDDTIYLDTAPASASNPPISGDWTNRASAGSTAAVTNLAASKVAVGGGLYNSVATPTKFIFDGLNAAGANTLTPSLFTNSQTFYSPSVAAVLSPSLFTDADTFFAPAVTVGAASLTPSLFTNSQTFYAATVTAGAVVLTPSLFTNSQTFYAPAGTVGAVSLTPSLFTNAQTFYAGTITVGAVDLTPALLTNSQTFYAATITAGAVVLAPALFTGGQTFYAASITTGAVDLTTALFTNAQAFYAPTVAQPLPLRPGLVANDNIFFAPTVSFRRDLALRTRRLRNSNRDYPDTWGVWR